MEKYTTKLASLFEDHRLLSRTQALAKVILATKYPATLQQQMETFDKLDQERLHGGSIQLCWTSTTSGDT